MPVWPSEILQWCAQEVQIILFLDLLEVLDRLEKLLYQLVYNGIDAVFRRKRVRFNDKRGIFRWFVRRVDSCEAFDETSAGLFVKALRITLFTRRKWRADIDFAEIGVADDLPRHVAIFTIGGDERRQDNEARVVHEFGDFSDAADVLLAVFRREAKIFVQAMADVVAVEQEAEFPVVDQRLLQQFGDGGFA